MDEPGAGKHAPHKVVIVDDHPVVREGLASLIDQQPDMVACGSADSAAEALRVIEAAQPDIAIVDLRLREGSGLDLIKDIRARFPKVRILVLSMRDEALYAERVLRAGGQGYIAKDEGTANVVEGIRKVLAGEIYLSRQMAANVLRSLLPGGHAEESPVSNLTDRELQVFELIGDGMPTSEIADRLHLSVKTIETYRERIKERLHIDTASELLKYAVKWTRAKDNT